MSLATPALRSCASCAEQTDGRLCCARCHTLYCSRACQKAHWSLGGHKKACVGLARAHRDTDPEVQSRALARVVHMSGGAPGDARCLFCLDGGDAEDPLMRGCACRGTFGWSHATCLVKMAEAAQEPPPPSPPFVAWAFCSNCKQRFTGLVQLRLAIVLWAKHARAVETDVNRIMAASAYASALADAWEHAEAARLHRNILDVQTQTLGPEHSNTLTCASDLAGALSRLGECAEAVVLLRTTLAARTRTLGPDDRNTLTTEGHLAVALMQLRKYAEAEALGRETLEKRRRVLGRDHFDTLATSGNLATSLSEQGKHAEALEIDREVLVSRTRLLGAEHERTLRSASNLGFSLLHCGQKTEAEQIFRETLALSLRVLGPTHQTTQELLQYLRALGRAAL